LAGFLLCVSDDQTFFQATKKPPEGGFFADNAARLAGGDVHGDFETETQVSSRGLGPHGEAPLSEVVQHLKYWTSPDFQAPAHCANPPTQIH
jgi:hypothetical protein